MEFITGDSPTYHTDVISNMIVMKPKMDIPIPFSISFMHVIYLKISINNLFGTEAEGRHYNIYTTSGTNPTKTFL